MRSRRTIVIAVILVVFLGAIGIGTLLLFEKESVQDTGKEKKSFLTEQDFEQIDYVNTYLAKIRSDRKFAGKDADTKLDTMLEAIKKMAEEGKISSESIVYDKKQHYITFEYLCGVLGAENFGGSYDTCSSYTMPTFPDLKDESFESPDHRSSILILDGMADPAEKSDMYLLDVFEDMGTTWSEQGVDTRLDLTVSLEDLMSLKDYDVVLFFLHGTYMNFKNQGKVPMMRLAQKAETGMNRNYSTDLLNGRIAVVNGGYAITADFLTERYGTEDQPLEGTIFFFGSCLQMGLDDEYSEAWADARAKIGVPALVAFHNEVGKSYASGLAREFVDQLLSGRTAKEAYNMALSSLGKDERKAYAASGGDMNGKRSLAIPCYRGDEEAKFRWRLSPTPIPTPTSTPTPSPTPSPTPTPTPTPTPGTSQTTLPNGDTIRVGDTIFFGMYPQSSDTTAQPIEWEVLEVKDGKALVISKYALTCMPYNEEFTDVIWETSTIRAYLNDDFIKAAFTITEQEAILDTILPNDDNPVYGTYGGRETTDKVFLLSLDEVLQYFQLTKNSGEEDRQIYAYGDACTCQLTEYAILQGAFRYEWATGDDADLSAYDGNCRWWLRSPGSSSHFAAGVDYDGSVRAYGLPSVDKPEDALTYPYYAVRPAMWIDLSKT
ncbi:MAG: hypothetical protein J5636_02910 [Clostridiales bacterium]|nr:hypothetical protein [Clostridiales bacterium]